MRPRLPINWRLGGTNRQRGIGWHRRLPPATAWFRCPTWILYSFLAFRYGESLAVEGGLQSAGETNYEYWLLNEAGKRIGEPAILFMGTTIPLPAGMAADEFHGYEIRTRRSSSAKLSKHTRVYFHQAAEARLQIVRIERQT